MAKDHLLVTFFSITILILLFAPPSRKADQLLYTYCTPDQDNYTAGSPFAENLNHLLQSLPSNTMRKGFNNTVTGEGLGKVFVQASCRGDVNSTVCRTCVENASREILKECSTLDAIIWYELCQVHYSFQNVTSQNAFTGKYPSWNLAQDNLTDENRFNYALSVLMRNLTHEAAFNPKFKSFATGEILYSKKKSIYGLVQCTRDILRSDCFACLGSALKDLNGYCGSRQAGVVVSRSCNVRFGVSRFYNSSAYFLTFSTSKGSVWKIWIAGLSASAATTLIATLVVCQLRRRSQEPEQQRISQTVLLQELAMPKGIAITQQGELITSDELPLMDLTTLREATENFSDSHKIGQGGFGAVYQGVLPDGKQIAVKRSLRRSWQGIEEFKNEVLLIARLQHRNLVRLLGCNLEDGERLLIYEFMPNKSLNLFIFDSEKRAELGWKMLCNIIVGIARGLVYLHEDSRLKIIHRDLKPSNILLDEEKVAKISDFGIARIFGENQNTAKTRRVVGTYGYMAPEYAMEGLFSVKSDVFSYGVILLEIISGRRRTSLNTAEHGNTLLKQAWQLWKDRNELEFVDSLLRETSQAEVVRCMHISLLCVQEDPGDRPTMSAVITQLRDKSIELPEPKQPPFYIGKLTSVGTSLRSNPSLNEMTVSTITPR